MVGLRNMLWIIINLNELAIQIMATFLVGVTLSAQVNKLLAPEMQVFNLTITSAFMPQILCRWDLDGVVSDCNIGCEHLDCLPASQNVAQTHCTDESLLIGPDEQEGEP